MRWLVRFVVGVGGVGCLVGGAGGCGRPAPGTPAVAPGAVAVAPAESAPPGSGTPGTPESSGAPADAEALPEPNRPLTAGERALLRPIFRDGIDYEQVRVIDAAFPFQPRGTYMTPRGHIYAPGSLFRDDFSLQSLSSGERAVFVHEMTHVWQYANGIDLVASAMVELTKHRGAYEKAYPYRLEAGRDLVDYGMEQQASILEDYYLVTVDHEGPYRMENRGLSARERDRLYAGVLRKFWDDARYVRALSARELADEHGMSSEREPPGPAACEESEAQHGTTHLCGWRFVPVTPPAKATPPATPKPPAKAKP